jgi:hypothetical protein
VGAATLLFSRSYELRAASFQNTLFHDQETGKGRQWILHPAVT